MKIEQIESCVMPDVTTDWWCVICGTVDDILYGTVTLLSMTRLYVSCDIWYHPFFDDISCVSCDTAVDDVSCVSCDTAVDYM